MYPDFNPSLTWLAADEGAMCTLLPLDGPFHPRWIRSVFSRKPSIGSLLALSMGNWQAACLPFSAGRSSVARNSLGSSIDALRQPVPRRA